MSYETITFQLLTYFDLFEKLYRLREVFHFLLEHGSAALHLTHSFVFQSEIGFQQLRSFI